jgi:hypothetical protein
MQQLDRTRGRVGNLLGNMNRARRRVVELGGWKASDGWDYGDGPQSRWVRDAAAG